MIVIFLLVTCTAFGQETSSLDILTPTEKQSKRFAFKNAYKSISFGVLLKKKRPYNSDDCDVGLHLGYGYSVFNKMHAGIQVGLNMYEYAFLTTAAEVGGDILKGRFTPFYKLNLGWGFNLNNDESEFYSFKKSGGILLHPSLGIKLKTKDKAAFTLGAGYRFQRSKQQYEWEISPKKITYRRLCVEMGIEF